MPKRILWTVLVSKKLDDALEKAVMKRSNYVSKSDFIRGIVREELRKNAKSL